MAVEKSFTLDDVEQILRVVDRLADVEVRLEIGDLKLHVRKFAGNQTPPVDALDTAGARGAPSADAPRVPAAPVQRAAASADAPAGATAIRAPMLGTFYRAPSPTEPTFVEVGSRVRAADPVCIVEVMKLFNTVNAGVDGAIVAIVAENGQLVEQGDVLFFVKERG